MEPLEQENEELKERLRISLADGAAKDLTIGSGLGKLDVSVQKIPGIAWCLMMQEYAKRKGLFQFVSEHGLRPKVDPHGNTWSIKPVPRIHGLSEGAYQNALELASVFGYDPEDPPIDDYMMLHCFPNRGSYEIAVTDIEKAQAESLSAQRQFRTADQAVKSAIERGRKDLADQAGRDRDHWNAINEAAQEKFHSCRAVIENAVERYYLIPIDAWENMYEYGMDLKCFQCTVPMQKKHQFLPRFEVQEPLIPSQTG